MLGYSPNASACVRVGGSFEIGAQNRKRKTQREGTKAGQIKPSQAGSSWKLEETPNGFFPGTDEGAGKGLQTPEGLTSGLQQSERIHFWCFKLPNLHISSR